LSKLHPDPLILVPQQQVLVTLASLQLHCLISCHLPSSRRINRPLSLPRPFLSLTAPSNVALSVVLLSEHEALHTASNTPHAVCLQRSDWKDYLPIAGSQTQSMNIREDQNIG